MMPHCHAGAGCAGDAWCTCDCANCSAERSADFSTLEVLRDRLARRRYRYEQMIKAVKTRLAKTEKKLEEKRIIQSVSGERCASCGTGAVEKKFGKVGLCRPCLGNLR
jgi:uncharacterized NAD(P)/FAD-binding protein YdhS